jgi:hypothetical protein
MRYRLAIAILILGMTVCGARADQVPSWNITFSSTFGSPQTGGTEQVAGSFTLNNIALAPGFFVPQISNESFTSSGVFGPLTIATQPTVVGLFTPAGLFWGGFVAMSNQEIELDLRLAQFTVGGIPSSDGLLVWRCDLTNPACPQLDPNGIGEGINFYVPVDLTISGTIPGTPNPTSTPEPSALVLSSIGLAVLFGTFSNARRVQHLL